jgi:hypothetical protein
MTPKEKAKELVYEMMNIDSDSEMFDGFIMKEFYAQRAALKAVDEILENIDYFFKELEKDGLPNKFDDEIEYWNEVKNEINKL